MYKSHTQVQIQGYLQRFKDCNKAQLFSLLEVVQREQVTKQVDNFLTKAKREQE